MRKQPLVSVIMNCHNCKQFLKKSISSVLKQTYKNWELIFWDNNSTENIRKIISSFRDKRIKYYKSKKYSKLYKARNLAIKKAKGKYLSFLDADDWWLPSKLEKQINIFSKEPRVKLVYSNMISYFQKIKKKKYYAKNKLPSGFILNELIKNYQIGISSVIFNKSLMKKYKFNENYEIIGDLDFFIKISKKNIFKSIQEPLVYYRWHGKNFSHLKEIVHMKELNHWIKRNRKLIKPSLYSYNSINMILLKMYIKHYFKRFLLNPN